MKNQSREECSVTETTFAASENGEYESWETSANSDSCDASRSLESESSNRDSTGPEITPKTIPVPDRTYKVVCLSFLDRSATAPVASKVFDESWRMLAKGGLLYVLDNRGIVSKVPKMRQMLSRVVQPTPRLISHDTRTIEILEANGFEIDGYSLTSKKVVRWMAVKTST